MIFHFSIIILICFFIQFNNSKHIKSNVNDSIGSILLDNHLFDEKNEEQEHFQSLFLFDKHSLAKQLILQFESATFWIYNLQRAVFRDSFLFDLANDKVERSNFFQNQIANVLNCFHSSQINSHNDHFNCNNLKNNNSIHNNNDNSNGGGGGDFEDDNKFPRNITDFFLLQWQSIDFSNQNSLINNDEKKNIEESIENSKPTTINHIRFKSNSSNNNKPKENENENNNNNNNKNNKNNNSSESIQHHSLSDELSNNGVFRMHLSNQATNNSRIDMLAGRGSLSRNLYHGANNRDFLLQGVYLVESGAAFLIASPVLANVSIAAAYSVFNSNVTSQYDKFSQVY